MHEVPSSGGPRRYRPFTVIVGTPEQAATTIRNGRVKERLR
jgi:hypothetical protein